MNRRWFALYVPAALMLAAAGCSELSMGPQPDEYVGKGKAAARDLSDADLEAVKPVVPGDSHSGAALLPAPATATAPATQRMQDETPLMGGRVAVPAALSLQDAVMIALRNNPNLRVQRYNVPIARTAEDLARAAFDPDVSGTVSGGPTGSPVLGNSSSVNASATVTEFLPTGTTVQGAYSTSTVFYTDTPSASTGLTLSITQSLLRGGGLDVNLATLREARLSTKITQYELRGFAESLVEQIESNYWDLSYAERQMAIVQAALNVATQQLNETNARIAAGKNPVSDRAAAEAEVALRRQDLINAQAQLDTARLQFLQLLTPAGKPFWDRPIELKTYPFVPVGTMDPVETHVQVALKFRPDVNETKLQMQSGDLEIARTKNGLLPKLDLFLTLGKTGLANAFGSSIERLNGQDYQATLGVNLDWEPLNRAAIASYHASQLTREQLDETMDNLVQTVESDIRAQYIEVDRTRKQIDASRATRIAQEVTYNAEKQKLAQQVAGSTSLTVALAERDLLTDQLAEVQAVTNHLKALVTLYSLEGSLLYRRGIDAPGGTPAPELAWKK